MSPSTAFLSVFHCRSQFGVGAENELVEGGKKKGKERSAGAGGTGYRPTSRLTADNNYSIRLAVADS